MRNLTKLLSILTLLALAPSALASDQSATNGGECDVWTGTRAQLLGARNADQLVPGCSYCVTDYSRGCLSAGIVTGVCVIADAAGVLGMGATVYTTIDNIGWAGRYDIDTGFIVELHDNRGNHADGTGIEVDRFPWTEAAWSDNTVEPGAVLICDCDPIIDLDDNEFTSDSQVDIRGATGNLRASSFDSDSILELDGASVTIRALEMGSRSRIYGERSTAVQIYYHQHDSDAYWLFRNRNDVRSRGTTMQSSSRVYFYSGARQWFYYCTFSSYGTHRQYAGTVQAYNSEWASYGETRAELGSGQWLIYGGDFSGRGYIRNFNTTRVRQYYDSVDSRGEMNFRGGADLQTYYNDTSSFGRVLISGTTIVVYAGDTSGQSTWVYTGGTHYRNSLSGLARVTTSFNTRSVIGEGSWAQTLTAPNTNRARDYFNNSLL